MKYYDEILDKRFADELYRDLLTGPWFANNTANRKTFPYKEKGSHLLMGTNIYTRENDYITRTSNLAPTFIGLFEHLCKYFNLNLYLIQISANLQFFGSDGTFHRDGEDNEQVFMLFLCNEILDKKIGGQFINETRDSSVDFRHGRIIEFKASDSHKGLAFNKPYIPRISVRFYAKKINE
tara:strand:- start:78 stop:617 length:540 start_codon:yes stop_codon:yes gene_type:complete